jgi:hypothetical protein
MISVAQASEKIISRSRYLTEAMSKDFLNLSSLARYILPEVKAITQKEVSEAAVLMALTRLSKKIKPPIHIPSRFPSKPEIIMRSPLYGYITNSIEGDKIIKTLQKSSNIFYRVSQTSERYLIIGDLEVKKHFINECFILAGITIQLPQEVIDSPGAFYFFLKSLAWEQINIFELFTQRNEFTIFVYENDAEKVYSVIRSLFT